MVSNLRSKLISPDLRNVIDLNSAYPYTPFLLKLSHHILYPAPQQSSSTQLNPDIIPYPYKNATIRNVLTGFSRLIGSSSNHPSSFSTIILFVVGGITFQEISRLQEMYRERGIRLVVGSNTISNRDSIMQHIFKSK